MDIETILEMYEDDYNPGPRPMAQGGRIPFGEAGFVVSNNKEKTKLKFKKDSKTLIDYPEEIDE